MPFVTSEGANFFLEMEGEGTPVLFLHDFGMDHHQWDAQAAALGTEHAVYRIDWRGHGESASTPKGHTSAEMCRDLVRIMVQVGMEKTNPGIIVAQGWAADAALRATLAEPRLLRGVVVVSPELPGHNESPERRTLWNDMRTEAAAGHLPAAFERYRRDARFDGLRDRPEHFAAVHAMHTRCTAAALLVHEDASDVVAQLKTAKVPILALAGALDREEFRSTARDIASTAPQGEWREIEASGHFPNLERPAAFEASLHEFMGRLAAAS